MIKSFYLHKLVYYIAGLAAVVFVTSYFFPQLYRIGLLILLLMALAMPLSPVYAFEGFHPVSGSQLAAENTGGRTWGNRASLYPDSIIERGVQFS